MSSRHLSPEIVSLIHHVELNESGWWKKAIGQVIKGVLWTAEIPLTMAALSAGLKRELDIALDADILRKQLEILISQNSVIRLHGDTYKLTEVSRRELTAAHEKATAEQQACVESFLLECSRHCAGLAPQEVWDFFSKSLRGAVQVAGANLYHLLADGNLSREPDWLSIFLSRYPEHVEGLRKVLASFFSTDNHVCRGQVLRLLTAHFFAEASQLRPATISLIEGARTKRVIRVVLDTNIIFSILQLHDNPADDAAQTLLDIAKHNNQKLEIKFYVFPGTLDEAQKTLANQMNLVRNIRVTNALAGAALTQPLPSIARKFFSAAKGSPGLTAEAFFQPYISDLRTILMGKNIHVLDAHPSIYNMRQDVVDDVLDEQEREKREVPESKRKGYDTLLHDVVLWHAIKDRRGSDPDTPFDVEYWAVSIDWRLMAFDKMKRKANESKLPLVLHPSSLVQLIQFWVPRSAILEEGLVDSLRLSLYFQHFDHEDERATIKVLDSISRFENVADLPESTLKLVLANQVLRGRLRDASASNDVVFELVRDELIAEHKHVLEALGETKKSLTQSESTLEAEQVRTAESQQQLDRATAELVEANRRAEEAERRAAEAESLRQQEYASHARQLADTAQAAKLKNRFTWIYLALPTFIGFVIGIIVYFYATARPSIFAQFWSIWAIVIAGSLLPLSISCVLAQYHNESNPLIANWGLSRGLAQVGKKAIVAPLLAGVGAIFSGAVWDGAKLLFGLN
jgi:hypothetical protein